MSTVSTPKPTLQKSARNYRRLFLIFFAAAAFMIAAASIDMTYKKINSLQNEMRRTQILLSESQIAADRVNNQEALRLARLEQAWRISEAKISNQEEHIQILEHALRQRSLQSDSGSKIREANLLQELKTHKDLYIQSQQKIQAYEKQLLALAQEMKSYKEQNQLIRQEQIKMKSDYQELLKKVSQKSQVGGISHGNLEKALESKLSQFVNADYEHEQKFKDLQKAVENCAKVGELKALEFFYDDKIDSLSNMIQNNQQKTSGKVKTVQENPQQMNQLKQEIMKLNLEKEEMRTVINSLMNQQRKSDERINLLEAQNTRINKQPEVRKPVTEQPVKEDLRIKNKQQPKTVSQPEETQEPENIFELLQQLINEQSETQEPSETPYFAQMTNQPQRSQQNNFNRNNRQKANHHPRGFGNGLEHLLHYL